MFESQKVLEFNPVFRKTMRNKFDSQNNNYSHVSELNAKTENLFVWIIVVVNNWPPGGHFWACI